MTTIEQTPRNSQKMPRIFLGGHNLSGQQEHSKNGKKYAMKTIGDTQ